MTRRPAAFLDRDGSIIVDTGFVRDPGNVRLVPGSAAAIQKLNQAGWAVVVVTNQSGIARGLLTEADYVAVAKQTEVLLAEAGARIDASYMCPHWPPITGECECRKPALGNYRRAIDDLGLEPARSLFAGDRMSDLVPARLLGGRGMLLLTGEGEHWETEAKAAGYEVAEDLQAAVKRVLAKQ
jgi:D-glycero-D-manno-heptose 1,7-bisphosphate phosphatase